MTESGRVLIAGVGYQNLRDLSLGPVLLPALSEMPWPPNIEIDDLSYGPIHVLQWLQERPGYYTRMVFVSAAQRGRCPGAISCYRWDAALPNDEEIQSRVAEAVTGVISLDNLLIITQRFGVLPEDIIVIEVEPEDCNWGLSFTPTVEAIQAEVLALVRRAAIEGCYDRSA